MLGALFFGFLLVRLVFGYWRLRTMTAAEGAMVAADTSWAESHRERVRVEKWRIWGRQRAAEQAKKEARERERRRQKRRSRPRAPAKIARAGRRRRPAAAARARRRAAAARGNEDDRPAPA